MPHLKTPATMPRRVRKTTNATRVSRNWYSRWAEFSDLSTPTYGFASSSMCVWVGQLCSSAAQRASAGKRELSPASACNGERLLLCGGLSACGESTAEASLRVTATGLEEGRTGIAAEAMADGFAVEFDHAYLSVESFIANTRDGQDAALPPVATVVDLIPQGSEVFFHTGINPIRWDTAGYTIACR